MLVDFLYCIKLFALYAIYGIYGLSVFYGLYADYVQLYMFYGNAGIQLHHTTFLQHYISLYTALSGYDEGCCCIVPVHRYASSVKITQC